jgi:hypothetical protein
MPCHSARLPAAFALISDYVSNSDPGIRAGAILGLGLAYAGTQREEVQELLVPLVSTCGCLKIRMYRVTWAATL